MAFVIYTISFKNQYTCQVRWKIGEEDDSKIGNQHTKQ